MDLSVHELDVIIRALDTRNDHLDKLVEAHKNTTVGSVYITERESARTLRIRLANRRAGVS